MEFLLQAGSWNEWFVRLAGEIQAAVLESITGLITSIFGRLPFLAAGLIVLILFWLLSKVIRSAFLAATRRARLDTRLRILIGRMIVGLVYTLGIFAALTVIIPSFNFANLIAGLGFTSFVVGFATKDILNNFLSGILILWHQPFHIGDYLFVGGNQGKVEYIGVRATSLRKDDGELVLIPNGDMYSNALTIRGAGAKRRMQIKFSLGFDAEVEQAKTITSDVLGRTEGVVLEPRPNVYVTDINSEGIIVTANFWLNTNESEPRTVYDRVAIAVMSALTEAGYALFSPGSMIVQPSKEGKPTDKRKENDLD